MSNPKLAAISLLSKKLVVPGTAVCFDFRVGPTGNIGETPEMANDARRLFLSLAGRLGVNIDVVLTDNRQFPCTALGRLESLKLLLDMIECRKLSRLDDDHLRACIFISARAMLAIRGGEIDREVGAFERLLRSGAVAEMLHSHLSAQGASGEALWQLLQASRSNVVLRSKDSGYWQPPDLEDAKIWIKRTQSLVGNAETQVGLRLLVSNNEQVAAGQPVVQVSVPDSQVAEIPKSLSGFVTASPVPYSHLIVT